MVDKVTFNLVKINTLEGNLLLAYRFHFFFDMKILKTEILFKL